ncbi:HEPN domain-containing protein [Vibrio coralliirubri]|uniref:HEPN domain-containing protein n=1 Tax=Vibrio coralliirubri TaxID=1516159 RepID=UPI00063953D4|nr:HEPN domain-containing protein [Vibrio coralliirubri]CDT11823.1 conserved hypothetical protein [Vibrio coralliirubri]
MTTEYEILVSKLSEALVDIPEPTLRGFGELSPFTSESTFYYQINKDRLGKVITCLESIQSAIRLFDNKMFNTGDGVSLVTMELLARWLVRQAQLVGSKVAVRKLELYLQKSTTSCQNVLAISGIKVHSELNITDSIKLIPFQDLPESHAKEAIYPPFMKPDFALKLGFVPPSSQGYRPPEAAVIVNAEMSPQIYSEGQSPKPQDFLPMYEFCEFLTLVKSTTPVPVAAWCELSEDTPCKQLFGGGWSGPVVDVLSKTVSTITQQDWDAHKELYLKFLALPQGVRDLLRVPIERLNQARRRGNMADRAIDLGVACEALFLNDKSHKEQISFTLRLRAALFLADEYEERQELLNFFSSLYSCRSQAAHTGKLDTKMKVTARGKINSSQLLQEGDDYCVQAIRRIISMGKFPDWNELMLKK